MVKTKAEMIDSVVITCVSKSTEGEAKAVVLEGLSEYFAEFDPNMNPDLYQIVDTYIKKGDLFLVGLYHGIIICTGALIEEDAGVGRIVRMSVKKEYWRLGLASRMLQELEYRAVEKGYREIVIETTKEWTGPIQLYKNHGYQVVGTDEIDIHFRKVLAE